MSISLDALIEMTALDGMALKAIIQRLETGRIRAVQYAARAMADACDREIQRRQTWEGRHDQTQYR